MELYRLDIPSYQPDALIEGYDSLIWTERYTQAGEFELKTPYIRDIMTLIPEGCLISHRDTGEVMIVENHEVSNDEDGRSILTTTGRSAETFLEFRNYGIESSQAFDSAYSSRYNSSTLDLASHVALWIYDRVVHIPILTTEYPTYTRNPEEELPNVSVTQSYILGTEKAVRIEPGPLYQSVLNRLVEIDHGIRMIRPTSLNSNRITFNEGGPGVTRSVTVIPVDTTLRFDIYKGADLSNTVVFDERAGDLEDTRYLRSVKEYANVAQIGINRDLWSVMSPQYNLTTYTEFEIPGAAYDTTLVLSGWDRRVLYVDVSSLNNGDTAPTKAMIADYVKRELAKKTPRTFFDGQVSINAQFKYREDYQLGDVVKRISSTGFSTKARISEYIRTQDAEGDRGYPTFVTFDDVVRTRGRMPGQKDPNIPILW